MKYFATKTDDRTATSRFPRLVESCYLSASRWVGILPCVLMIAQFVIDGAADAVTFTGALVVGHLLANEVAFAKPSKQTKWTSLVLGECAAASCASQALKEGLGRFDLNMYAAALAANVLFSHFKFRLTHAAGPFVLGAMQYAAQPLGALREGCRCAICFCLLVPYVAYLPRRPRAAKLAEKKTLGPGTAVRFGSDSAATEATGQPKTD